MYDPSLSQALIYREVAYNYAVFAANGQARTQLPALRRFRSASLVDKAANGFMHEFGRIDRTSKL